ncbi:hypothetical protein BpHYR1_018937 [Brachionus plicatilis]|uniref:Uncharacterized protein n=1 Tax=Brachionus plicatilis TaxID=10195 RepID=A0A3M7S6Z0_BRAPC|nr:hypothetical protein BpHYR1_018937 [Brachionus plicatilis]
MYMMLTSNFAVYIDKRCLHSSRDKDVPLPLLSMETSIEFCVSETDKIFTTLIKELYQIQILLYTEKTS